MKYERRKVDEMSQIDGRAERRSDIISRFRISLQKI